MKRFNIFLSLVAISVLLVSCNVGPKPIAFEEDDCDYCQMTISDTRYGAELVTKKGRVYKFDDLHCLKAFIDDEIVEADNIHSTWVVDFINPGNLINTEEGFFLQNDELQSPMGSNTAAFSIQDSAKAYYDIHAGIEMKWKDFLAN